MPLSSALSIAPVCAAMGIGRLQSFMAKDPMEFAVLLPLLAQAASASKCRCGYEGQSTTNKANDWLRLPHILFPGAGAMAPSSLAPDHNTTRLLFFPPKLSKAEGLLSTLE
jgi:hypothetical protein